MINKSTSTLALLLPWLVLVPAADSAEHYELVNGIPAADVIGSEDIWGNPTFIGGITNKGPDSQSVW